MILPQSDEERHAETDAAELRRILADPDAVHRNLLRGTIACPSATQLRHLIRADHSTDAEIAARRCEIVRRMSVRDFAAILAATHYGHGSFDELVDKFQKSK